MIAPLDGGARWPLPARVLFRFGFVYFVLYCLPWPIGWLPFTESISALYDRGRDWLLAWFGNDVLGVEKDLAPFPTGSGDTTRDYVLLCMWPAFAAMITVAWSLCTRAVAHPRLADLLRIYLRYVLAVAMLGYGTAKWFDGQFREIDVTGLLTTWGDSSPMGVVWKFMGSSPAYTAASGIVECTGGVLLLWRRTASLGAVVTIVAMTNIALINFCFDVPVKLYSSHLLLMAMVVLWYDAARLWAVLVAHRAVAAEPLYGPGAIVARRPFRIAKVAAVGWLLWASGAPTYERWQKQAEPRGPLAGTYEVVEFARGGAVVPPLRTDDSCWRHASFQYGGLSLHMMDGRTRAYYRAEIDEANGTVTLRPWRRPDDKSPEPEGTVMKWCVERAASANGVPIDAVADAANGAASPRTSEAGARATATPAEPCIVLEGTIAGSAIRARLKKVTADSFFLKKRGYHWINEYPLNR